MPTPTFAPGFRFSKLDAMVILAGVVGAALYGPQSGFLGFIIAFVVAHFFLFCNIVRMARRLELAWAAVFVFLSAATLATGQPGWLLTATLSLVMTVIVVVIEMRKPSYHGVAWQRINPGLPDWWQQHFEDKGNAQ